MENTHTKGRNTTQHNTRAATPRSQMPLPTPYAHAHPPDKQSLDLSGPPRQEARLLGVMPRGRSKPRPVWGVVYIARGEDRHNPLVSLTVSPRSYDGTCGHLSDSSQWTFSYSLRPTTSQTCTPRALGITPDDRADSRRHSLSHRVTPARLAREIDVTHFSHNKLDSLPLALYLTLIADVVF